MSKEKELTHLVYNNDNNNYNNNNDNNNDDNNDNNNDNNNNNNNNNDDLTPDGIAGHGCSGQGQGSAPGSV